MRKILNPEEDVMKIRFQDMALIIFQVSNIYNLTLILHNKSFKFKYQRNS